MAAVLTSDLLQSRLFYVTLALSLVTVVIAANVVGFIPITVYTYKYARDSVFSPANVYSEPQNVSFFGSMLLSKPGKVIEYTTTLPPANTSVLVVGGGDAVEVSGASPVFTVGLRTRSITPGTYECANVVATMEGAIDEVSSGVPFPAETIEHGSGSVADALSSPFLTHASAPFLTNESVFSLNPQDFIVNTATPGLYEVSIAPSAVASQTCTFPVFISFADGVKVSACVSGPAPGTIGGAVLLDGSGKIPSSFLPSVIESRYRGLWDAGTNTPGLEMADCTPQSAFYYTVSLAGNITLGQFFSFQPRDLIVCFEGTWSQIACMGSGVDSFNSRLADVVPEAGDYTATLIRFNNGTLQDFSDAPLIVWQSTTLFPNSELLSVEEMEFTINNATIGLATRFLESDNETVISGYISGLTVDDAGTVVIIGNTADPVVSIVGTTNQINASPGPEVTLSLPQDWDVDSDAEFRTFTLGSKQIVSDGASPIHFPDVGASSPLMTESAQTADGLKTLLNQPTVLGGNGVRVQRGPNDGSMTIRPSPSMSADLDVYLPPTEGVSGQVFRTDGVSQMDWTTISSTQWVAFTPSVVTSTNVASVVSISGFFTGNLTPGSLIEAIVRVQVTRVDNSLTTSVTFTVPTNVQTTLVSASRGRVVEDGPIDMYGYVQQGFGPNEMRIIVRGTTGSKNGHLFAHFFYVVA